MKHLSTAATCLIVLALLFSCDEDKKELSKVALMVTPSSSETISLESGDKSIFSIELYATEDFVRQVKISSFDAIQGQRVLKDTTFAQATKDMKYVYEAPAFNRDTVEVTLTFEGWDKSGSHCEITRKLTVTSRQLFIAELAGIVLRSSESGWPDAFSFSQPSQTFNWKNSPDSINADIYLQTDPSFAQLAFRSNTSAKMTRINNFDYAAATAVSLQAVYENSKRDDIVDNLKINDIILVGHGSKAEGVLRITNIIRQGDDNEKCVQLAFKASSSSSSPSSSQTTDKEEKP